MADMAVIDKQNLSELDVIINRLKEFRDHIAKNQGVEMKGSRIGDRFKQDRWLVIRWEMWYVDDAKWDSPVDMKNLPDALKD
jgi:hypothetical protein